MDGGVFMQGRRGTMGLAGLKGMPGSEGNPGQDVSKYNILCYQCY